jgi:hypothetical protein
VDSKRSISNIRELMAVSLDDFNVSVGNVRKEYEFTVKLNLTFKPKARTE